MGIIETHTEIQLLKDSCSEIMECRRRTCDSISNFGFSSLANDVDVLHPVENSTVDVRLLSSA